MSTVRIERAGNLISVTPPYLEILGPSLTYMCRNFEQSKGQTQITYDRVKLYRVEGQTLYAPAGLFTRVCKLFSDRGISIEYLDHRKKQLPKPDLSKLAVDGLRDGQEEALAQIFTHSSGQIEAPTAFGKSYLICQICGAYPTCHIVICAREANVVDMLYSRLNRLFPGEVGQLGGNMRGKKRDGRILVSTARSLYKADLDKIDIFIYDEVHTAASPETSKILGRIRNAHMFGLSATVEGRFDNADLCTEALFGPVIYRRTYRESVESKDIVPITVFVIEVRGEPTTLYTRSQPMKKRKSYWQNYERNQLIANVASCFPADWQTMIMCETADHVFRLSQHLPGYDLVYSNISGRTKAQLLRAGLLQGHKPMTPDRMNMLRRMFESQKILKVICTNTWGTGVDFTALRVLIRADGATGEIKNTQIPGRLSRLADGKEQGILVDFADYFDPWAAGRTKSRLAVYREHGWAVRHVSLDELRSIVNVSGVA